MGSDALEKALKKDGYRDGKFTSLAFVMDTIGPNQLAFICINACNFWLAKNLGLNLSIFFMEYDSPSVIPDFATFHSKNVSSFKGHLIATSASTTSFLLNECLASRVFYIYCIDDFFKHEKELRQIMLSDNIIKVVACDDYNVELTKRGYKITSVIEDFDINKFMEIAL